MSRYGGYFQVQNLTKQKIKSGSVTHHTTDYGDDTLNLLNLPAGGVSGKIPLYASTSNTDGWKIEVTLQDGTVISENQNCAFQNDNAGCTVIVQLIVCNDTNNGINIVVPWAADRYENTSW